MELSNEIIDFIQSYIENKPHITHAAIYFDGLGGYQMYFCKTKENAEVIASGNDNYEVIEFI